MRGLGLSTHVANRVVVAREAADANDGKDARQREDDNVHDHSTLAISASRMGFACESERK